MYNSPSEEKNLETMAYEYNLWISHTWRTYVPTVRTWMQDRKNVRDFPRPGF